MARAIVYDDPKEHKKILNDDVKVHSISVSEIYSGASILRLQKFLDELFDSRLFPSIKNEEHYSSPPGLYHHQYTNNTSQVLNSRHSRPGGPSVGYPAQKLDAKIQFLTLNIHKVGYNYVYLNAEFTLTEFASKEPQRIMTCNDCSPDDKKASIRNFRKSLFEEARGWINTNAPGEIIKLRGKQFLPVREIWQSSLLESTTKNHFHASVEGSYMNEMRAWDSVQYHMESSHFVGSFSRNDVNAMNLVRIDLSEDRSFQSELSQVNNRIQIDMETWTIAVLLKSYRDEIDGRAIEISNTSEEGGEKLLEVLKKVVGKSLLFDSLAFCKMLTDLQLEHAEEIPGYLRGTPFDYKSMIGVTQATAEQLRVQVTDLSAMENASESLRAQKKSTSVSFKIAAVSLSVTAILALLEAIFGFPLRG